MASIKPRRRHGPAEASLKALEAEMQQSFSIKMGELKGKKRERHEEDPDSGVVYVSHIPRGFFENQMKKFFKQFGNIKRLRLSRSKKSGNSRGYAFIEFEFDEVAKVVAETMHNYLMYQKLLKCFYVPKEKLHPDTFKGCFTMFKKPRRREISAARNNSLLVSGKEHILESQKRRVVSLDKKQKKLEKLGIDFKIEGVDAEWQRLNESKPPPRKVIIPKKARAFKKADKKRSQSRKPTNKQDRKGPLKRKRGKTTAEPKSKKQTSGAGDDVKPSKASKTEKEEASGKNTCSKETESKATPRRRVTTPKKAQASKMADKKRSRSRNPTNEKDRKSPLMRKRGETTAEPKSKKQRSGKKKSSKETESKATPGRKLKVDARKGTQSAKVSSKEVRTAGKKARKLSI